MQFTIALSALVVAAVAKQDFEFFLAPEELSCDKACWNMDLDCDQVKLSELDFRPVCRARVEEIAKRENWAKKPRNESTKIKYDGLDDCSAIFTGSHPEVLFAKSKAAKGTAPPQCGTKPRYSKLGQRRVCICKPRDPKENHCQNFVWPPMPLCSTHSDCGDGFKCASGAKDCIPSDCTCDRYTGERSCTRDCKKICTAVDSKSFRGEA